MRQIQSLGFDPTERLQVLKKKIILWELRWQLNRVVAATLRDECESLIINYLVSTQKHCHKVYAYPNLLDLFIVGRGNTVYVGCHMSS